MRNQFIAGVVAVFAIAGGARANLFVNAGFEDPITFDGAPFVGFWEGFSSGPGVSSMNGSAMPRSGAQHAELLIDGVDNAFAGVFQDVTGLSAGEMYTFSGWHATPSNPLDVGIEFRIEWRDSGSDTEISRTPSSTTAPLGSAYEMFSLSGEVPIGADTARLVYAIQTFGGDGPTNTGAIYLDDMSFALVPTPGSAALLGFAGLGLVRRGR